MTRPDPPEQLTVWEELTTFDEFMRGLPEHPFRTLSVDMDGGRLDQTTEHEEDA